MDCSVKQKGMILMGVVLIVYIVRMIVRFARLTTPLYTVIQEETDSLLRLVWWHENVSSESSAPILHAEKETPQKFSEVKWRVTSEPSLNLGKKPEVSWQNPQPDSLHMYILPIGSGCQELWISIYSNNPQYFLWTSLKEGDEFSFQPAPATDENKRWEIHPSHFEGVPLKTIYHVEQATEST